jgi:hypothetical protein
LVSANGNGIRRPGGILISCITNLLNNFQRDKLLFGFMPQRVAGGRMRSREVVGWASVCQSARVIHPFYIMPLSTSHLCTYYSTPPSTLPATPLAQRRRPSAHHDPRSALDAPPSAVTRISTIAPLCRLHRFQHLSRVVCGRVELGLVLICLHLQPRHRRPWPPSAISCSLYPVSHLITPPLPTPYPPRWHRIPAPGTSAPSRQSARRAQAPQPPSHDCGASTASACGVTR